MWDFILQIFSRLNIDSNVIGAYDAFMAGLATLSLAISGLNKLLKKKGLAIDTGEVFGKGKNEGSMSPEDKLFIVDLVLLALNVLTWFIDIPKEFYLVLLLISIAQIVAIAISLIGKLLLIIYLLFISIKTIFEGEVLVGIIMIVISALFLLAAAVGALHALLIFNKVLSIVRVLA